MEPSNLDPSQANQPQQEAVARCGIEPQTKATATAVGTDQTRPSESAPGNPILLRRPADNVTAVTPERPSGQPGHPHGPTAASSPATGHTLLAIRECRARLKAGPGAVKGAPRRCPTPGLAPRRAKNRGARRRPNPTPLTAPGPASASLRCFECRGACALNSRRPRRSAPTVRTSGLAARQGRSRGPEKRPTKTHLRDPAARECNPRIFNPRKNGFTRWFQSLSGKMTFRPEPIRQGSANRAQPTPPGTTVSEFP